MAPKKLLVSDFDGTFTRRDFYACAVDQLLKPHDLEPWHDYTAGRLTHFECLQQIFARLRGSAADLDNVIAAMQFDARAPDAIAQLRDTGWEVVVVSNGCGWYIERLFARFQIDVELHTNPGEFFPERGLELRLPRDSPFFCEEVGISKTAVVKDAISRGFDEIAFAGDGRPDLAPALLVPPHLRFAREWLADTLTEQKQEFRAFEAWSEIADLLCESTS